MSDRNEKGATKPKPSRGEDTVDMGAELRVGTRGAQTDKSEPSLQEKKNPSEKKDGRPRSKVGPFGYIGVTREGGEKRRFIAHVAVG